MKSLRATIHHNGRANLDSDLPMSMYLNQAHIADLRETPDFLWTKYSTDKGSMNGAGPIKVEITPSESQLKLA